ncbi:MAG: hypothetical protein NTU60_07280 [Candidatus Aminicenantes bacterium]|nr:hypothetical protein [Candidatus Aminicenantes bacterium]
MRSMKLSAGIYCLVLICSPLISQSTGLVAEKALTIGPGAADGPYQFVRIADVKVDSAGNIYVLDSARARIAKFNARGELLSTIGQPLFEVTSSDNKNRDIVIRASRDSGELSYPQTFYLDKQSVFITDMSKIVVYSATGEFQRAVSWKQMVDVRAAFLNAHSEVVLLGSAAGRDQFFHVLDGEGKIARSYGDNFEIPEKLAGSISADQKENIRRVISSPISFCLGFESEILVLNPFRYEIRIYREENLWKTIIGTSEYSGGLAGGGTRSSVGGKPSGYSIGYVAPPVILKKDDLILVFQVKDLGSTPSSALRSFQLDVFKNSEYYKSFDLMLEGYPKCLGPNGHVFTIGGEAPLLVYEYILKSLPEF